MLDSWLDTANSVLRPARPNLDRYVREAEAHVIARRAIAQRRAEAKADCERRIESARTLVFAANDGVVTSLMTELEREWRWLARRDPDEGLMDFWARIAPKAWIDRKLWRAGSADTCLDLAIALAADAAGVMDAECAAHALREALAPWGIVIGARLRWCTLEDKCADARELTAGLLAVPVRAITDALEENDARLVVLERAKRLARDVEDAASTRLPETAETFAGALGRAASADFFWGAAIDLRLPVLCAGSPWNAHLNPVSALRDLWRTGYTLSAWEASGMTLGVPLTGISLVSRASAVSPSS